LGFWTVARAALNRKGGRWEAQILYKRCGGVDIFKDIVAVAVRAPSRT
jgi:hypothetical protein